MAKDANRDEPERHEHERIIKAFCDQFVPPLTYCKVDRVNGVPVPNMYQTALWDQSTKTGFTVLVQQGQPHVHIETHGVTETTAAGAGQHLAASWGRNSGQG